MSTLTQRVDKTILIPALEAFNIQEKILDDTLNIYNNVHYLIASLFGDEIPPQDGITLMTEEYDQTPSSILGSLKNVTLAHIHNLCERYLEGEATLSSSQERPNYFIVEDISGQRWILQVLIEEDNGVSLHVQEKADSLHILPFLSGFYFQAA